MTPSPFLDDAIIYQEMMSHPALFSHPHPYNVAIIGDEQSGIATEVLKHAEIQHLWHITQATENTHTQKTTICNDTLENWLPITEESSLDILIIDETAKPQLFKQLFNLLRTDGLLIQQANSPFEIQTLKTMQKEFADAGFLDIYFLNFPQPTFLTGWRTAILAKKDSHFRRIREKDIYNKSFTTRYYNFDAHKAALALPEFMREELEPIRE